MKFKKYIFGILLIFGILILWNNVVYAGDLKLRNLTYNVVLNSDGTANITETWDISIENTNTLFRDFEIDDSKYSGITNVSLEEITNGVQNSFTRINKEKYHVDKNCFYALVNSKGKFEIAWGVHEDNSYARRTFKINYTVLDAVKNYADASEFYWKFISTSSSIPATKVTGTITLPANVENFDDFRVWAHGPLNGNIYKTSNNSVTFEVQNLSSRTMLETRIVTPTYIFGNNKNVSSYSKLNTILSEEQSWAEKANKQREAIAQRKRMRKIITFSIFIITNLLGILIAILLIHKIKKYKEVLQNAPDFKPKMPSKYYRDIPNENSTPAQAAFIYYFKRSGLTPHISDVFSATMLNLCLKKYLNFEMLEGKKLKVILTPNTNLDVLSKDELLIYKVLESVSPSKEFTMKDFEKYCKKHSSYFLEKYNLIKPYAKKELEIQGYYDKTLSIQYNSWSLKAICFLFLAIASLFMLVNIIPSIICVIYCFKIASRYNTLTQKGVDEKEAWTGLKNYMEDFSMMDEKEVPELVLWEKYLVYATAFGISDKVLKQLKVVYPQMMDSEYMVSNGYSYLFWMSHGNFNNNFIHSINSSINNVYNSINYSSGSGSGGGFSGGGGFGGGGGRNGWKIIFSQLGTVPNWENGTICTTP